jgi:hypothetical protein
MVTFMSLSAMNTLMIALPPGPSSSWPVQLWRYVYQPTTFLADCARRYGDVFTVRLGGAGTLVVVHAPEHVRQVFTGDASVLQAGRSNAIARPIVGENSVFVMDGAAHLRKRRLLLPPFHGERMGGYAELIVETTHRAVDLWRPAQRRTLHRDLHAITLDIILRAVAHKHSDHTNCRRGGSSRSLLVTKIAHGSGKRAAPPPPRGWCTRQWVELAALRPAAGLRRSRALSVWLCIRVSLATNVKLFSPSAATVCAVRSMLIGTPDAGNPSPRYQPMVIRSLSWSATDPERCTTTSRTSVPVSNTKLPVKT